MVIIFYYFVTLHKFHPPHHCYKLQALLVCISYLVQKLSYHSNFFSRVFPLCLNFQVTLNLQEWYHHHRHHHQIFHGL